MMFGRRKHDWKDRLAEAWPNRLGGRTRSPRRLSLPRLDRFDLPRVDLSRVELPNVHLPSRERLNQLRSGHSRRSEVGTLVLAALAGAALAYFLDPDRGRRRRKQGRDRVLGSLRGAGRKAGRAGRHAASDLQGASERMTHEYEGDPDANDATLAQRVQTQLFRDPDVPKGQINVNVERGVVVLRGEIDDLGRAYELERLALEIPGVLGVENLLRTGAEPRRHDGF